MYKVPLSYAATSESPILSQDEISVIFSNIEIIFNFNKELLDAIEQRIKFWTNAQKIGDIFVRMVDQRLLSDLRRAHL